MQRESSLERSIRCWVTEQGGLCLKQPSNIYKGIPDRLIITQTGKMFFVELKDVKGELSPLQITWINKLQKRNVSVYVVKFLMDFKEIYKKENER